MAVDGFGRTLSPTDHGTACLQSCQVLVSYQINMFLGTVKTVGEPSAPQGCPSLADSPTASPREATNLTINLPSNLAILQFIYRNICYGNFLIVSCGEETQS